MPAKTGAMSGEIKERLWMIINPENGGLAYSAPGENQNFAWRNLEKSQGLEMARVLRQMGYKAIEVKINWFRKEQRKR